MFIQLRMFNIHRIEKVVGPVFGPDFGHKSDFFRTFSGGVPGVSRECWGVSVEGLRAVSGWFPGFFSDFFGKCPRTFSEYFPWVPGYF